MRIIRLTTSNVKKLKAIDITPQPHMNQVSGRNGNGKSSLLDSILWALAGKDAIQSHPIREGTHEAVIRLDLGEIIVKRTIEREDDGGFRTKVLVLAPGAPGTPDKKLPKLGSPQEMLDAILGELAFDPLAFARMKPREQFDELRRIAKVPIDLDALDAENESDYKARTKVNGDAKALRAQAEAVIVPDGLPSERISEAALLDSIEQASGFNADIEKRKLRRQQAATEIATLRHKQFTSGEEVDKVKAKAESRITELMRQVEQVRTDCERDCAQAVEDAKSAERAADALESKLTAAGELPEPLSVSDLRQGLEEAQRINSAIAQRERRMTLEAEATALETRADELTERMRSREASKREAIKAAEMPIPGIGFGESSVTYNGIPLDQASDAEKLRVSVSIAMAANPKLRVLRIKDGSLLDDDNLALIAGMAETKDYQVWIERITSTDPMAIVMEDGEVKG